jgi:thioredoxin reductase (NADPH)
MKDEIRDLVIIGGGPSGLSAAIYAGREKIDTVVFEKQNIGGMTSIIDRIDNYPGYSDGIDGFEFSQELEKQAKRFGAQIEFGEATSISEDGDYKVVTVDGKKVKTRAVLIATGRGYGTIGAPGEAELFGKGVHYCATCDGAFYNGRKLAVVGGGNSAIQESIYLTRFASHIDLLVRSTIRASKVLHEELEDLIGKGKITVHIGTVVNEIVEKNGHVGSLKVTKNGEEQIIEVDGVFIFAGLRPNSEFVAKKLDMHESGFINTNHILETNMPGVFASGDVRNGSTMQIASAVGEGVTAALSIREYLGCFIDCDK